MAGELVAVDAFSETVANGDGSLTVTRHTRPQRWLDTSGAWRRYVNDLRASPPEADGMAFANREGPFGVRFAPPAAIAAARPVLRLGTANLSISLTAVDAAPSSVERDGRTLTYRAAWPGADLVYTLDNELVKEEIVLSEVPGPTPAFAFELALDGLRPQRAPGGGLALVDVQGDTRFAMPPLVMFDNAAEPAMARVAFTLEESTEGVLVTLRPDPGWLSDRARVYPVRIDPSLAFIEHRIEDDSGRNATINEASPNTNYYGLPTLAVGKNGSGQRSAALVRFPGVTELPADSVITHAVLELEAATGTDGLPLNLRRLTDSWNDTTVTWNTAPSDDPAIVATSTSDLGGKSRFTVTGLVQSWVDASIANRGVRIGSGGGSGQTANFHSSWATCTGCQPELELTYVPATAFGRSPLRTYTSAEYGGGNSAGIEISSGNLVFTHDGGRIDGRGFGVQLVHTYNSADPVGLATGGGVGVYGEGWSFAHNLRLFEVDGNKAVVLKDGTGYESRVFLDAGTAGGVRSYTAPIHHGYRLEEDVSSPPADKVWTLTSDAGAVQHFFDAEGKLTRIEDRNANYLTFAYDGNDRLTTITDLAGRTTTLVYNGGGGRLSKITDMAGREHTYAYSGAGDLTTIKHGVGTADEVTTTLGYDDAHRLVSVTNPRGHTAEVRYTAINRWETSGSTEGWVASTSDAAISQSATRAHSGSGSLKATLTNAGASADAVIEKDLNADPQALSAVAQELLAWVYLPSGSSALRARLTFEYVDNGQTSSPWVDLAAGSWTAVVASPALVEARDQVRELELHFQVPSGAPAFSGEVWVDDVALRGQVASQSDAKPTPNTVVTYAYDVDATTSTVSRPDTGGTFRATTYEWSRSGTVQDVTDPLGNASAYERDSLLRVLAVTPAGSGAVPYQFGYYPNSMQLATATSGSGETTRRGADLTTGDTTYLIDPRNEWRRSQNMIYDATRVEVNTATGNVMGLAQNQYAAGVNLDTNLNATPTSVRRRMDFTYYTGGLLETMTDPLGRETTFDYIRNRGYLTSIEAPAGDGEASPRLTTIDRNADGSVNYLIDPEGQRTEFTYDGLGRLETIRYGVVGGVASFTVSYGLDANGNLTSMTDQAGSTTWSYDPNNRVTSEARTQNGTTETASYSYYANGLLQTITTFGGQSSTLGYDAALRLTSQTDPTDGGQAIVFEPDARGRTERITFPSGVKQAFVYEGDHLAEVRLRKADNTYLQRFTYDYGFDANGNITADYQRGFVIGVAELGGSSVEYDYDALGRLEAAVRTGTNAFTHSYAYDAANNRTSFTGGGTTTTYTYDDANQLISSSGGVSYDYDRNGNLVSYDGNTFSYDASNKWVSGSIDGDAYANTYDGLGRQVSRSRAGARTDYWFDATGMTLESGAVSASYLRDPSGRLLSGSEGSAFANFGHDRLGSVTATVATNQTVSEAFRYDPWGSTISASSGVPLNRLRFTGARRDAGTGFYTLGQRYYAPSLARFTQLDPLPASVTHVNRHTYAGCNPVNYTDPTGQFSLAECDPLGLGVGLGLVLIGSGFDVAVVLAEVASAGLLTWAAAAGLLAGTSTILTGIAFVNEACGFGLTSIG